MKKKILSEIISYLEEFIYRNRNKHESILTLAHFYYIQENYENFRKNVDLFVRKTKKKNLGDLEKLFVNDEAFGIVLQEELYSYIEKDYHKNHWDEEFVEKCISFTRNSDQDYLMKPYLLCELLINNGKMEFDQKVISQIVNDYSNTKWELIALNIYTKGRLENCQSREFESREKKWDFLEKVRDDIFLYFTKYSADERAIEMIFEFVDLLKEDRFYTEVLRMLVRMSEIVKREDLKLRIFYEMGIVYFLTGRKYKAIQIFSDFFANFETSRELLEIKFKAAIFLKEKKLYKNSYLIFKDIGERFKSSGWAILCSKNILEIALIFFDMNDYKEAIFFLDEVLKLRNNRDDVSTAMHYKAVSCERLSEECFSYDEKKRYQKLSHEIFLDLAENYNDNHEVLSKIPAEYLETKKNTMFNVDFGYIFFVMVVIIVTTVVLFKMI